ncbi:MAG: DUF1207 domain-containing protein [Gemmatimonadetes bacterium]|nr:DUF1207 domain-containing protein [Gemmatimonadota bacterium]NNM07299.1 DUF1207 domain-containing protein [Gemmatimonadota bacterium]
MSRICQEVIFFLAALLFLVVNPDPSAGQTGPEFFPAGATLPRFLAGPRDPISSFGILGVLRNPNQHGDGVEVEVSFGHALPVLLFRGEAGAPRVLLGLEAGVFARFGLQVLERELIATDWYFMVPAVWPKDWGWVRFRYYHSSSHMGDEYSRRFEDLGVNFSRDAADLFAYYRASEAVGIYSGFRYSYNVHPEESGRLVLRAGAEAQARERGQGLRPYVAADLEWDEDTTPDLRLDVKIGAWLPQVRGRRTLRLALGALWGPSPLGQFQYETTTQIFLGLQGYF